MFVLTIKCLCCGRRWVQSSQRICYQCAEISEQKLSYDALISGDQEQEDFAENNTVFSPVLSFG